MKDKGGTEQAASYSAFIPYPSAFILQTICVAFTLQPKISTNKKSL